MDLKKWHTPENNAQQLAEKNVESENSREFFEIQEKLHISEYILCQIFWSTQRASFVWVHGLVVRISRVTKKQALFVSRDKHSDWIAWSVV